MKTSYAVKVAAYHYKDADRAWRQRFEAEAVNELERLSRNLKKIETELQKEQVDLNLLSILKVQIMDKFQRLDTCQNQVSAQFLETKEAEQLYLDDTEEAENYRNRYIEICSRVDLKLQAAAIPTETVFFVINFIRVKNVILLEKCLTAKRHLLLRDIVLSVWASADPASLNGQKFMLLQLFVPFGIKVYKPITYFICQAEMQEQKLWSAEHCRIRSQSQGMSWWVNPSKRSKNDTDGAESGVESRRESEGWNSLNIEHAQCRKLSPPEPDE
ncbi:hypothetical protein HNY73_008119 [Argiope bruennichi]|uniref:Uncharacterized protein n=1 Tax=Argiope bruennichi TaxID=94029 RepID=A0A8T0F7U4_ARGBR|nr:hypothetical protein HNY73_008119 [Argiope bruennichi]